MKKYVGYLFLFCLFFLNIAHADDQPFLYTKLTAKEPMAPVYLFNANNSVGHTTQKAPSPNEKLGPEMPYPVDPVKWSRDFLQKQATLADDCNVTAMLALTTPDQVVNYVQTHTYSCMNFLWYWDDNFKKIFTTNNLTAIANKISAIAPQYDGTNSQNVLEMLFFTRVAYYHEWYRRYGLDKTTLKPIVTSALNALFSNNRMFDNTSVAANNFSMLIQAIDASELYAGFVSRYSDAMEAYFANLSARLPVSNQGTAIYDVMGTMNRGIGNRILTNIDTRLVDNYKKYALLLLDSKYAYIPNNAVWGLGLIADRLPTFRTQAYAALETALNTHPYFSEPWLWAAQAITLTTPCVTLSTGQQFCIAQVKTDLKSKLLNRSYSYDNGDVKFLTSLSQSEVDALYYGIKEVKALFGRVLNNLNPVPNDPNQDIEFVIFPTPSDYSKYLSFLFNVSAGGGGVYIEQYGQLYTFQRTNDLYSLQELARHEYGHYLQGRYVVEGMWGEAPIYSNNRMMAFEEGTAEFFAGAYPRDEVPIRYVNAIQIKWGGSQRLPLSQVIQINGNTPNFYNFTALMWHFFYKKHLDLFKNTIALARAANITGFDALVSQIKQDTALNTEFQAYVNDAVSKADSFPTPTTVQPNNSNLVYGFPQEIQKAITATNLTSQISCAVNANGFNKTTTCTGQIAGAPQATQNEIQGWYALEASLNQFQKAVVAQKTGVNTNWMTCWFGATQWKQNSDNTWTPSAAYSCDTPLGLICNPPLPPPAAV